MRDSKSPTGAKPKPWKQLQKSMSKGEKIPKTPSPKKLEENGNSNKKTSPKFKLSLKKSPSKDKVIDKSKELSPLIHKQKASLLYSTNDLSSMVKVKEEVDSLLTKKKGSLLSIKSAPPPPPPSSSKVEPAPFIPWDDKENIPPPTHDPSNPLPLSTVPLLPHGPQKSEERHFWKLLNNQQSPLDLDTLSSYSEPKATTPPQPSPVLKNVNDIDCDIPLFALLEDTDIVGGLDDIDAEEYLKLSDYESSADDEDDVIVESEKEQSEQNNGSPNSFWKTRSLRRLLRNTLNTAQEVFQNVPRMIREQTRAAQQNEADLNNYSDVDDDYWEAFLKDKCEPPKLTQVLSLAYLDHFLLPDEKLKEEDLKIFMDMLNGEKTEEELADSFFFLANDYPIEDKLVLEVVYRALCNSENEHARLASLQLLPQLAHLFQHVGHKHKLIDLLCAYMRSIRFFDSARSTESEQEEVALLTSLRNEKRSNPNTILFLPIRSRTKASQPTVEQILDVCHEYIISVALEVPQRDVIAETFTNLLDVLNRCTWKLRDEIFVFLDKVVNMFPSNVYVENHVLFRVFLQASLSKRADNRELALRGLASLFNALFTEKSGVILEDNGAMYLQIFRILVYTKLIENSENYRNRQRYGRFVVEVFDMMSGKCPLSVLLDIFGQDIQEISADSIPVNRLYFPKIVSSISLRALKSMNSPNVTEILNSLLQMSLDDPDKEVRRTCKLIFLQDEGFAAPDVLDDLDEIPISSIESQEKSTYC